MVISEYLDGNRIKYIGPLSYLVVMSALYVLSFQLFNVDPQEYMGQAANSIQSSEQTQDQQAFMQSYMQTFTDNLRLVVASLIPFFSLSLIIFYSKKKLPGKFPRGVICVQSGDLAWHFGVGILFAYRPVLVMAKLLH